MSAEGSDQLSPTGPMVAKVHVGGSPLSEERLSQLLEIRVELQFQVPGRATLRFADPGYSMLAGKWVKLGSDVTIEAGTVADMSELIEAEVTSISSEQRPGQTPELVVVALDKGHRLGRATTIKVFQKVSYSDIVTQIASDAGLTAEVDSTGDVLEYLMQAESDMALITEMARRTGYDWWVSGKKLYFKKPKAGSEVKLTLGDNVLSFSARAAGFQPSSVKVDGWDRDQQQLVTSDATQVEAPHAKSDFADLTYSSSAFGSAKVMTGGMGAASQGEAGKLAQSVLDRAVTGAVTAKGTTFGNGKITLGSLVKIDGGGPLNGTYPVTQLEHVYSASGFMTRFTSGERRPTTLVDTLSGAGVAAYTGPAHTRSGVTVGRVTSNNDPDKRGRVRVRYPGVSSDAQSGWARVATIGGGKNRGSVWIPEVDDEVLVAFEGGDARHPVVIGGLFGQTDIMPETGIQDGKVQTRAMTSRLGHVIAFQDGTSPDKEAIELILAGKQHLIHLGKDKVSVKVPSGVPVEIIAGNSSAKFSDSGDVTVEAVNVNIKAQNALKLEGMQVSIQAQTNLEMKGQVKAALEGTMVEIQGQAETKVAGGMVMIN